MADYFEEWMYNKNWKQRWGQCLVHPYESCSVANEVKKVGLPGSKMILIFCNMRPIKEAH